MPRTYRQLDLAERRTIVRLLNAKMPVAGIAQELGRHRSTSIARSAPIIFTVRGSILAII